MVKIVGAQAGKSVAATMMSTQSTTDDDGWILSTTPSKAKQPKNPPNSGIAVLLV